jgi:hypothetical protein
MSAKRILGWTTFVPLALVGVVAGYIWLALKDGFDSAQDIVDWIRDEQ